MKNKMYKLVLALIAAAVAFKVLLFCHVLLNVPQAIFLVDSHGYLADAQNLENYFSGITSSLGHSFFRTPGYPFFLYICHFFLKLPFVSVIFLQLVLNFLTAVLVYRIATSLMDRRAGLVSAAVFLLDTVPTVYAMILLTESLYLFVMTLFLFFYVKYLKKMRLGWFLLSFAALAVTIYIRPIGYYLPLAVAGLTAAMPRGRRVLKSVTYALIGLALAYGLVSVWQYRNWTQFGEFKMSSIENATIQMHGLIGRYPREKDAELRALPPFLYYVHCSARHALNLMTSPANFKYFHSRGWKLAGVVVGYLGLLFLWFGLVYALRRVPKDRAFVLLALIIGYFMTVTVVSVGWEMTPRFRAPMAAAMAVLSGCGWSAFRDRHPGGRLVLKRGKKEAGR